MSARVLVVDDEPANLHAMTAILRSLDYRASIATSGLQALQVLDRQPCDLVLLDVMMPGIDGFETCRRIRERPEWRDIPVIFLTARSDTAAIVRAFELGAVDYVSKPFNAYELKARVTSHVSLAHLHRENRRLLLNVLPVAVADRLAAGAGGIIADRCDDVSILFIDIAGFTPLAARLDASRLVRFLNDVFSAFDEIVDQHRVDKIKTLGDGYMAAAGLPGSCGGHLEALARTALAILRQVRMVRDDGLPVQLRFGLHVGRVIAGVIGAKRFSYDVWGEAVNLAQRLESHGLPDRIQVSEAVHRRLHGSFVFEPRPTIELKGYGVTPTWFLVDERAGNGQPK